MPVQPTVQYPLDPGLECSLVMKGGITSGVIYPRLACRLASQYRLFSIGGSSAGAIAAAAAAVAELRRQRDRSDDGFVRLHDLPKALGEQVGADSRLLSLFRPHPRTAPLFKALMAVIRAQQASTQSASEKNSGSSANAMPSRAAGPTGSEVRQAGHKPAVVGLFLAGLGGMLSAYPLAAILGTLPAIALVIWSILVGGAAIAIGILGAIPLLVAGVLTGLALGVKRTLKAVSANYLGMCTGMGGTEQAPALTDWLHSYLQQAAGQDHPVTFGDLESHDVTLKMMTTNLTQGRPMAMPWHEGGFFFDPSLWKELFPPDILTWMEDHPPEAPADADEAAAWVSLVKRATGEGLRPLPSPADLPILVAVRMSLSFPLLISAIPMHAVDFSKRGQPFAINWFTDGGLCANLPVYFFDHPLPTRPTFAIDLQDTSRPISSAMDGSYLPLDNEGGISRRWRAWTVDDPGALGAFAGAMIRTWQCWVDSEALRMPGHRDRVVTIYNTSSEGGMNLNMPDATLTALAERGEEAATKLVHKFTGPFLQSPMNGFDNHRWIRLRTLLAALDVWTNQFKEDFATPVACARPYDELAGTTGPLPSYDKDVDRVAIHDLTQELLALAAVADPADISAGAPHPVARVRLVPDDR